MCLQNYALNAIDTEIKAKRNNTMPELILFRITKAKAKAKFGAKSPCERSSVLIKISTKAKATKHVWGVKPHFNFHVNGTSWKKVLLFLRSFGSENPFKGKRLECLQSSSLILHWNLRRIFPEIFEDKKAQVGSFQR